MADDEALRLCGPCRHFQMAFSGDHTCALHLPLQDGLLRLSCDHFSPFALGEGSLFEQSDCCAGERGEHGAHPHAASSPAGPEAGP